MPVQEARVQNLLVVQGSWQTRGANKNRLPVTGDRPGWLLVSGQCAGKAPTQLPVAGHTWESLTPRSSLRLEAPVRGTIHGKLMSAARASVYQDSHSALVI